MNKCYLGGLMLFHIFSATGGRCRFWESVDYDIKRINSNAEHVNYLMNQLTEKYGITNVYPDAAHCNIYTNSPEEWMFIAKIIFTTSDAVSGWYDISWLEEIDYDM